MSIEADPEIQGVLIKNQAIILEPNRQQELEQKGYGEIEKDKLYLITGGSGFLGKFLKRASRWLPPRFRWSFSIFHAKRSPKTSKILNLRYKEF